MNRKNEKSLIVGLDIGTSKTVAIVGEYLPGDPVEIIGVGSHASRGLKRGVVVDIESTVSSIQRAVEEAELMAGCEIRSVYASISGSHIKDENSHGTAPIREREVTVADLDAVLNAASALAIPGDRWMHFMMFCAALAAPVTRCTLASRRTPDMPTGLRMPSCPSIRYSCGSL